MNEGYLNSIRKIFRSYKDLAEKAMMQVGEKELFVKPSEESNSIAIIVQHMAGNMISRWTDFLTSDGEKPNRNRDAEFEELITDKDSLMKRWDEGWNCFLNTLDSLTPGDMEKTVYIRGEAHFVFEAINRQIAHYSYHTGQIVFVARLVKNEGWKSLSIPKGESSQFNEKKFGETKK